ncbi:hypothetical protein [Methylocystis sp. ATCC 49242]|uniref:hypothetical protein n=1 Tax=Methylocystis sp. ATCC 49242 TaxID=622637 RepID=UPI00118673CD|nr:hypothetical protein [Methylocystis sp. ATCC 49242]
MPPDEFDTPDKVKKALIEALRAQAPSGALEQAVADMLDPAGNSEFRLVVTRKRGRPGQNGREWFLRLREVEEIYDDAPSEREAIETAADKLGISEVTARKYIRSIKECRAILAAERDAERQFDE